MSTELQPGDRVQFLSKKGLKLRCLVIESLGLKARAEDELIPVIRDIKRKVNKTRLDDPASKIKEQKIRWIKRSELRKLPSNGPEDTTKPA